MYYLLKLTWLFCNFEFRTIYVGIIHTSKLLKKIDLSEYGVQNR